MLVYNYMKTNLRAAMEYRTAFLIQVFGMMLNNAAFIFFWMLFLDRVGGSLNGYGFQAIAYQWSLVTLSFGLTVVIFGNAPRISEIIMQGELDVYLLQPVPLLPNLLASRMQVSGLGDALFGLVVFALTQQAGVGDWLFFLYSGFLGILVFAAVFVLFHSLTFFLGNSDMLAQLAFGSFVNFSTYPGSIIKGPIRILLLTGLPVAWAAWAPTELAMGLVPADGASRLQKVLLMTGADLAFLGAAVLLFSLGLKRYESGNRVGSRL